MFDGKRFFPLTGMPMRKIACINRLFALAEPVPLTVPILKAKSLTRDVGCCSDMLDRPRAVSAAVNPRPSPLDPRPSGVRQNQFKLSHVPRRSRAPLGAEAAMQTDVFVLHHDALRLWQRIRREDVLCLVRRRRGKVGAEVEVVNDVRRDR